MNKEKTTTTETPRETVRHSGASGKGTQSAGTSNGIISENPSIRLYDFETAVGAADGNFPERFTLPRTAEVKNQGATNSCCGCAMATIAEYIWEKEFSEGWSYAKFRTHSGEGLYMQKALDMWKKIGALPAADFGALCEMPEIRELAEKHPELLEIAAKYKIRGYAGLNYALRDKRDKAIKQALMSGIPVLAAITYMGGGHAVALDGWDDKKDCYTIQNSYGRGWGENGYGEIKKSALNDVYAILCDEPTLPFEDVSPDRWSYSAIKHMYMSGLLKGVSDTSFEPERAVTREELAAVLDRLCEKTDERLARIYDIMNSMSGKV